MIEVPANNDNFDSMHSDKRKQLMQVFVGNSSKKNLVLKIKLLTQILPCVHNLEIITFSQTPP